MPSTIGSSIIPGNFSTRGITGLTGITGITGNTGPTGLTTGNTGGTGDWISSVSSNLDLNTITFNISSGADYTFTGFTGTTGTWSNTIGVSGETGNTYFSPFNGITGITFNFYGLSAGANTTISLEGEQAVVRFSSVGSYGISASANYVPYINGNTLDSTRIYVNTNDILNFGLTGIPVGNPMLNPLFKESKLFHKSIWSGGASDPANIVLDLSQSSVFYIQGPLGITGFTGGYTFSNVRQEYTLIINTEFGPVLNLPKNLYFSNNETTGIKYSGISGRGLHVVSIWSDNGGVTFNGSIIQRNISYSGTNNPPIADWGSCCVNGNCLDDKTVNQCNELNGVFSALTPCSSRTTEAGCNGGAFIVSPGLGVCCCGITGCIDYTNAPYAENIIITDPVSGTLSGRDTAIIARRINVTRNWCDSIGGTFKQYADKCATYDKYPGFFSTRRRTNTNTDSNTPELVCPNGCLGPVTCCVDNGDGTYTATQETEYYCVNKLQGVPHYKTKDELNAAGGCDAFAETGWCRKAGSCTSTTRADCGCGAFYTGTNAESECENGELGTKPTLSIDTSNPIINVVHSIDPTKTETLVSYNSDVGTPATSLDFTLMNAPINTTYYIGGKIQILDTDIAIREIDVWSLGCFNLVFSANGNTVSSTDAFQNGTTFSLTINSNINDCITQFGGDVDFAANLILYPVSCIDGELQSTSSITIPLNYTKSPCSCLAIGGGGNGITGDIINKYPITIPFTATRYCAHCTNKEMRADLGGSGAIYVQHIPYPIKTQSGFITFCPNTLDFIDGSRSCENPVYWCVRYGTINELNGCTYSSLFDANFDNTPLFADTNIPTATPPCYHAEYNEPGAGTTYWFSGDWDYVDINSADSKSKNNLRPCRPECRVKVPYSTCAISPDICGIVEAADDFFTTCCRTCPGTPLFVSDPVAVADNPEVCDGWICQDYQPYFNIVSLDKNVINAVAQTHGIDAGLLQVTLQNRLQNYIQKQGEVVVARMSQLFNPLMQNKQTISGPVLGTDALDPDNLAKASCEQCKDKFNKDKVIQVPYTNDITFQNTTYDVYGIVLAKETTCTQTGSYFSGKDAQAGCVGSGRCNGSGLNTPAGFGSCPPISTTEYEYKYYTIIVKNNSECMNVYNIGTTSEIYRDIGSSNYLVGCGGGSIFCNTDCGNGAQLKEVKWFGTLNTTNPGSYMPGFCTLSKQVPYTIKKDLSGIAKPGTGLYSLNDIIEFTSVDTSGSEPAKLTNLGNILKNIFNKEKPTDYLNKICIPCSETAQIGEKGCSANVIPELLEFIGKDCFVSGFDGGAFNTSTLVYDNTDNINTVTLQNNGVNKNVIWLTEGNFRQYGQPNQLSWDLSRASSTPVHNMWKGGDKYANSNNQKCELRVDSIDNRWLKNNNISYLEVKDGKIFKTKTIFQSPGAGLTMYGFVFNNKCGSSKTGQTVRNLSGLGGWSNCNTYFDSCSINPSDPDLLNQRTFTDFGTQCGPVLVGKYVPKVDLNNLRPVTKIGYSNVYYPDPATGGLDYSFRIRFLTSAFLGQITKRCAIKVLWTDGTIIYDITVPFKMQFGYDATTSPYILIDLGYSPSPESGEIFNIVSTGSSYQYHEISGIQITADIVSGIPGNLTMRDLLKSGNVYILARESYYSGDIGKVMYSNYLDWERKGLVPYRDSRGGTDEVLFNHQFYPYDSCYQNDIVLEDYALSRLIPIQGDPESAPTIPEFVLTQIKNKYINDMCVSIDCTNAADLCSNLTDC